MDLFLTAATSDWALLSYLLLIKHFIADGPLQFDFMAYNKGKFLHPGGLLHGAAHGVLTLIVLTIYIRMKNEPIPDWISLFIWIAVLEAVAHYFIDLITRSTQERFHWIVPKQDEVTGENYIEVRNKAFYRLLVADQCAHFATYVLIVGVLLEKITL